MTAVASRNHVSSLLVRAVDQPSRIRSCHCGSALSLCTGCATYRCLSCDPYTSEDCRWGNN